LNDYYGVSSNDDNNKYINENNRVNYRVNKENRISHDFEDQIPTRYR